MWRSPEHVPLKLTFLVMEFVPYLKEVFISPSIVNRMPLAVSHW
jgi:hypothetical protein